MDQPNTVSRLRDKISKIRQLKYAVLRQIYSASVEYVETDSLVSVRSTRLRKNDGKVLAEAKIQCCCDQNSKGF
jgi:hypothetical protein